MLFLLVPEGDSAAKTIRDDLSSVWTLEPNHSGSDSGCTLTSGVMLVMLLNPSTYESFCIKQGR